MDPLSLACANVLVGNAPAEAAIELTLLGGTFAVEGGPTRVAVAGAPCSVAVDGQPAPHTGTILLQPGQSLSVGAMRAGVYAYVAVAGGFAVPPQLGSRSLHQRAKLGGFHGRSFEPGDRVPLGAGAGDAGPLLALAPVPLWPERPLRVVLGPQDDYFSPAGIETFLTAEYRISPQADRMGFRLGGPRIEHARGFNIVSDGIVAGSVQVPGGGEPIVMMADRQTTGGYPKIATVASADLRVLAQRRPGDAVRFEAVSVGEAQALAREAALARAALPDAAMPLGGMPASEQLLALNLAGAAVNALSGEP
jgi:biotin-dependent carboxylase-like uncharacterized protein